VQLDNQRANARHAPKGDQKREIADVRGRGRQRARAVEKSNRDRLDVAVRLDDRLQQRALERQQFRSVGRRALGKYRDNVAPRQCGGRLAVDAPRIAESRALDEQRADV